MMMVLVTMLTWRQRLRNRRPLEFQKIGFCQGTEMAPAHCQVSAFFRHSFFWIKFSRRFSGIMPDGATPCTTNCNRLPGLERLLFSSSCMQPTLCRSSCEQLCLTESSKVSFSVWPWRHTCT
mmetsp:Transcript_69946/g.138537  ORF Transcript_69946/g.138537 Transcript_69946/m.138537 type:complete len:122 (+) Transcript_69946:3233-3598(+)